MESSFHHIWKQCGRPNSGIVYDSYKTAKRNYRKVCNKAINNKVKLSFKTLDQLYKSRSSKQFWNVIRKSKSTAITDSAISMKCLTDYFTDKLSAPNNETGVITETRRSMNAKYKQKCENRHV